MFTKTLVALCIALAASISGAHSADEVKFGSIRVPVAVFVGIKKGFFAKQNIDVEPVFFKSGAEMAPALATGQVDAAITTSGAAIFNAMARGGKMTIVAEALALEKNAPGGDPTAIVVRSDLVENGTYTSPKDLKGLTMAVTAPGQILDAMTKTYLEQNGLAASDIKTVGMPMPDMVPALSNHVLDAAILIDPFLSMMVDSGKVKVVARSSDILPNASQAFLAISDDLLHRHDVAVRFVRGYVETNTWMRHALTTKEGRKDIAEIFQQYVPAKSADVYEKIAIGTASETAKVNVDGTYGLNWQLQALIDQGLIKGDPKLADHLNTEILKEALSH